MTIQTRRFLSLREAADYVSADPRTIRKQIAEGELTEYRLGRVIRIDIAELERNMRPNAAPAGGE